MKMDGWSSVVRGGLLADPVQHLRVAAARPRPRRGGRRPQELPRLCHLGLTLI